MKIVIIEDERAAVRNLTPLPNKIKPNEEIMTILDSISSTIEQFSPYPMPELIFMDIHLADGSAFEIFNHINITCPIIFTTAYGKYALRVFKVNSTDYLLRPIGKEDVEHALDKLQGLQDAADKHQFPFPQQESELLELTHSFQKQEDYKSHFLVPSKEDKLLPVSVDMIQLSYIRDYRVRVVLADETEYCFSQTLDGLIECLNPSPFFQTDRQYLVLREAIKDTDLWFNSRLSIDLYYSGIKEKTLASKARVTEFKEWFSKGKR